MFEKIKVAIGHHFILRKLVKLYREGVYVNTTSYDYQRMWCDGIALRISGNFIVAKVFPRYTEFFLDGNVVKILHHTYNPYKRIMSIKLIQEERQKTERAATELANLRKLFDKD